jgi:hypothetical protein
MMQDRGPSNFRRQRKKFNHQGDLAPGICVPLVPDLRVCLNTVQQVFTLENLTVFLFPILKSPKKKLCVCVCVE